MFTIGDFARHGRVSVRMLRHYDAIGLLSPAHVDRSTGYRYYRAEQLSRLNRLVALKDLGFTLRQVGSILDEDITVAELRAMLRLRRTELEETIATARSGLLQVEARLHSIEKEDSMPDEDIIVKKLPAVDLAELSAPADSFSPHHIGPVVDGLFDQLRARLAAAGVSATGPDTVYFETPDQLGEQIIVHAGLPVATGTAAEDFDVTTLPPVETAATVLFPGLGNGFLAISQQLVRWVDTHGYRFDGLARQISFGSSTDTAEQVAELQAPIVRTCGTPGGPAE
ncbi:MerR family transcriptional regulator [Stackebrandtia nassauensis]|uniref:Transcriptional regulator, MerR family n=1 Tax=Stackebrandtia nassauensis (strain DSM 44728 / CIP 108903 / NRRL B-16338 / NBRC 102104 / LLR-40K-21) TaxID=446470 RepID=D3Q9I4_STANL|nr:transcriptional regulator, MerR family [Stackebrandtia nassauensis DSM 44728]